ncbi:MAG: hypothetical protein MK081_13240 [Flavobacteriales bacterium]|nr:hypothetical protein [Flavobacteriales bacterium]
MEQNESGNENRENRINDMPTCEVDGQGPNQDSYPPKYIFKEVLAYHPLVSGMTLT